MELEEDVEDGDDEDGPATGVPGPELYAGRGCARVPLLEKSLSGSCLALRWSTGL